MRLTLLVLAFVGILPTRPIWWIKPLFDIAMKAQIGPVSLPHVTVSHRVPSVNTRRRWYVLTIKKQVASGTTARRKVAMISFPMCRAHSARFKD